MRGESRSGFASRRACGVTHDPGVPFSRDSPFNWALHFALPSMRAFATRIVPAFDADHLLAPPLALMRLTLLADTLSFHSSASSSQPNRTSSTSPSRTLSASRQTQVKCSRWLFPILPR